MVYFRKSWMMKSFSKFLFNDINDTAHYNVQVSAVIHTKRDRCLVDLNDGNYNVKGCLLNPPLIPATGQYINIQEYYYEYYKGEFLIFIQRYTDLGSIGDLPVNLNNINQVFKHELKSDLYRKITYLEVYEEIDNFFTIEGEEKIKEKITQQIDKRIKKKIKKKDTHKNNTPDSSNIFNSSINLSPLENLAIDGLIEFRKPKADPCTEQDNNKDKHNNKDNKNDITPVDTLQSSFFEDLSLSSPKICDDSFTSLGCIEEFIKYTSEETNYKTKEESKVNIEDSKNTKQDVNKIEKDEIKNTKQIEYKIEKDIDDSSNKYRSHTHNIKPTKKEDLNSSTKKSMSPRKSPKRKKSTNNIKKSITETQKSTNNIKKSTNNIKKSLKDCQVKYKNTIKEFKIDPIMFLVEISHPIIQDNSDIMFDVNYDLFNNI